MTPMLLSPTPSEAEEFADTHMHGAGDTVLIVVVCCSVEYVGRARSTLGWGERIVIVKPDGSVLVHIRWLGVSLQTGSRQARGSDARQKPTATPPFLTIHSYRLKPPKNARTNPILPSILSTKRPLMSINIGSLSDHPSITV